MRINNITLEVCVSGQGEYKFEPNDTKAELILVINRYKKYIQVFVLDRQMGYISKRDTPNVLSTIKHMNKQIRVKEWKLISKTKHYLILQLHLCSYDTYTGGSLVLFASHIVRFSYCSPGFSLIHKGVPLRSDGFGATEFFYSLIVRRTIPETLL